MHRIFGWFLVAVCVAGCRTTPTRQEWKVFRPPQLSVEGTDAVDRYRIGMGDILAITPTSTGEKTLVTVGTDGTIRLIGKPVLIVDGMTIAEIESQLSLTEPSTVEIAEYRSQVIHVAGVFDGEGPRVISYRGPETVEQLIGRVGCKECQSGYRVRIVRSPSEVGAEPEIISMDFDERRRNRDMLNQSARIKPGDFVYVEKNLGHKGPLTLLTDRGFLSAPSTWMKKVRLAKASDEIDRLK